MTCRPHAFALSLAALAILFLPSTSSSEAQTGRAPDAVIARVQAAVSQPSGAAVNDVISDALIAYPADPDLHNLAGVAAAQLGDTRGAETHFQRAVQLAPQSTAAYENLGRLYQEQAGSNPQAAKSAIDVYRRLLRISPSNAEGNYQLAILLTNNGAFREGLLAIERLPASLLEQPHAAAVHVAALQGSGLVGRAATLARTLASHSGLTEVDVLRMLPAFEKAPQGDAVWMLLDVLAQRPAASPDVLRALAVARVRAGDLAAAREGLERAAAGGPNVAVLLDLARIAYRQKEFEGALGYLAHARELEPSNAGIHFFFGLVCIELNLGSESYESLKKAFTLEPHNPSVNYVLGAVALHRHERAEALPYFKRYVELMPKDPRGRFALGVAYFYADDLDRSKQVLTQAAMYRKTAGGAHYFLARIARQQSELHDALRHLQLAIRRVPGYPEAYAELGLIYTRLGRLTDAEASLRKALTMDPDNYAATVNLTALYTRTRDPRKQVLAAKLQTLQQEREARAQEFLRIIEVRP
jgi:Flp pilus assembly protein TadD